MAAATTAGNAPSGNPTADQAPAAAPQESTGMSTTAKVAAAAALAAAAGYAIKGGGVVTDATASVLDKAGSGLDAIKASPIGKIAGNSLVNTAVGAADVLANLGAAAGWVSNETATNMQMAEAVTDYLGGKIDGKTTVNKFVGAAVDRAAFNFMGGDDSSVFGRIAIKAVSFALGKLAGYLMSKVEDGVLDGNTPLEQALDKLKAQKNISAGQDVASAAPTSGLPPQGAPAGGGRAAAAKA